MGYKNQSSAANEYAGVLIKNPGFPHAIYRPSWEHPTVFKLYPEVKDGNIVPFRLSEAENDFSEAVAAVKMVKFFGALDSFTYVVDAPNVAAGYISPTEKFANTIIGAVKSNPGGVPAEWGGWTQKQGTGGPKLSKPQVVLMLQGCLVEHKGKRIIDSRGVAAPKHPVILTTTLSVRWSFEDLCNKQIAGYTGDPHDYNQRYEAGDLTHPDHGRPIKIFQATGGRFEKPHYECAVESYTLQVSRELIQQEWVPWHELIYYPDDSEQVSLLLQAFPPEAVDFVLGQSVFSSLLPDNVRGCWAKWESRHNNKGPVYIPPKTPPANGYDQQPQEAVKYHTEVGVPAGGTISTTVNPPGNIPVVGAPVPSSPATGPNPSMVVGNSDFGPMAEKSSQPPPVQPVLAPGGFVDVAAQQVVGQPNPPGQASSVNQPVGDPADEDSRVAAAREQLRKAREALEIPPSTQQGS